MSQNTILALQSLLIFLTMINTSIALLAPQSPALHIIFGAAVAALQFYVQHLGNQSLPPALQQNAEMQKNVNKPEPPK